MERHKLLSLWISKAIVDNPEIIRDSKTHVEVYQGLYDIWIQDVNIAMKEIAEQVIKQKVI